MSAALSTSQAAVVRSTSTGGSVTAEASPRVAAFFLELVLDEPAQDAVPLPDVEQFLDAACSPCGVLSLVGTQPLDEAQARALLELRPVFLGAVQVWPVGSKLHVEPEDCKVHRRG